MNHVFRYGSFVISLFTLVAFCLSGCSRTPQSHFLPGTSLTYERSVKPTPPVQSAKATEIQLSASSSDQLPAATERSWATETATKAEPAIHVVVKKPTLWNRYKQLLPRKATPPGCDQIVLRNGDVVDAKVKEVGVNEIRYKKCDRQDGPDYTISKRDVLSIKYSNGEVERFNTASTSSNINNSSTNKSYNSPTNSQSDGPRTDPFAIVAIAAGGLAILTGYGAFLLGAAALIFGALSLSRIRKEPNRFKGKGLALAGMIAGIVAVAFIVLYLYVI